MRPSEILLAVRELVAEKHHTRSYGNANIGYCTLGALMAVVDSAEEYSTARAYIKAECGNRAITSTHDKSAHLENVVRLERAALAAMKDEQ